MTGFRPKILLTSCFSSDFSFEIHVSIRQLYPNERYEIWTFFPDGEAIGAHGLRADDYGNLVTPQGDKDIVSGSYSVLPTCNMITTKVLVSIWHQKILLDSWYCI